jgi:hypothetical protein
MSQNSIDNITINYGFRVLIICKRQDFLFSETVQTGSGVHPASLLFNEHSGSFPGESSRGVKFENKTGNVRVT